jgi:hypothetical protein
MHLVWTLRAKCVYGTSSRGSVKGKRLSPRDALETVRERIEGEGVTNSWSTLDTKVGDLCVHLIERCFEAECFADEVEGAIVTSGEGEEREGGAVAEDEVRGTESSPYLWRC